MFMISEKYFPIMVTVHGTENVGFEIWNSKEFAHVYHYKALDSKKGVLVVVVARLRPFETVNGHVFCALGVVRTCFVAATDIVCPNNPISSPPSMIVRGLTVLHC